MKKQRQTRTEALLKRRNSIIRNKKLVLLAIEEFLIIIHMIAFYSCWTPICHCNILPPVLLRHRHQNADNQWEQNLQNWRDIPKFIWQKREKPFFLNNASTFVEPMIVCLSRSPDKCRKNCSSHFSPFRPIWVQCLLSFFGLVNLCIRIIQDFKSFEIYALRKSSPFDKRWSQQ